ncbi:MAG TPA: hypothetical protein ENH80_15155 [Phycisphaerae bacterium]|nr:hypothetical protein [Phycisphaerae bacterium]HDZ45267.1 hypothetical protein [Phycisphaerae bacterium]
MGSKYPQFDRNRLKLQPLSQRKHEMDLTRLLNVGDAPEPFDHPDLPAIADAVAAASARGAAVVVLIGAHVIKQGLSRYLIDLIGRGHISALATNGAAIVHDFELARIGATTESVAHYISQGQFGLWAETGELNDIVVAANADGLGLGEGVGKAIADRDWPHTDVSIFAAAYARDVPATVHLGIGYDIVHEHPNFDGAAAGEASYRDFLILANVLDNLDGGVVLSLGSAVMAPEVFLKALAMARNVAHQQGRKITDFTTAVFDLVPLSSDLSAEAPKDTAEYYFRPFKTLLLRTVADGGRSFYIRGDHRATIPALHSLIVSRNG